VRAGGGMAIPPSRGVRSPAGGAGL
jgi:hypothetical protein